MIQNVRQVSALKSRHMVEGLISTPYIFLVHALLNYALIDRKCRAVSLFDFAGLKEMRVRIALTKARKELSLDILFYLYVAISGRIIEYNLHT